MEDSKMKIEIVLTEGSFNSPCEKGVVKVTGEIRLPAKQGLGGLVDELVFGSKVKLLGESLYDTWGSINWKESYRYKTFTVSGETFAQASKSAIEVGKQALEPLMEAVKEHRKKLKKVGSFQSKRVIIQV